MNWKHSQMAVRVCVAAILVLSVLGAAVPMAAGQDNTRQAELQIEQERHVTTQPDVVSGNGSRVYETRGRYLEIEPQNFQQDDVTTFSVQESEGVLTYDKSDREYVLDSQGNAGTYHLSWTVSTNDSTAVYTATIRVAEADYEHLPASQYENLRSDSQRGSEVINRFENAGKDEWSMEYKLQFSEAVLNFRADPFSALKGQFVAIQTLRFMTPAGWLDLGLIVVLVYALTRGLYATIARLRKQLEKEEQVQRREDKLYIQQFKQILAGQQITDVEQIDDHQAAVLEERLGPNLFTALRNFWSTWGPDALKKMYADAMGTVGYRVEFTRNSRNKVTNVTVVDPDSGRPVTDGGDPEDAPEGASGEDAPDDDEADDGPGVKLGDAPDDVIEAMEWEQIDQRVFQDNPDISAIDHLMVANREDGTDLIGELNISIPDDFQSRKEFMDAIGYFLDHVQKTEFTDDETNVPREDRTVLNHLMVFATVMDDVYDLPLDLYWRAAVWNAEGLSQDDSARSTLNDITDANELLDEDVGGGGVGS